MSWSFIWTIIHFDINIVPYLFLVIKVLQTCHDHSLGHLPALIFLPFHTCSLWLMCCKHAMITRLDIYPALIFLSFHTCSLWLKYCKHAMVTWTITRFDINIIPYPFHTCSLRLKCCEHAMMTCLDIYSLWYKCG